jgi:hypothetical protein
MSMVIFLVLSLLLPPYGVQIVGPGVISTSGDEFGGAMTPDGQTMFFDRSLPRHVLYVICVSHRSHGRWSRPEIAPFSGRFRDSDPVISPDGKRLYFASDRPWPGQKAPNYDIWFVELHGSRTGEPHHLEGAVNSESNEYFASEAADGALYVASDRPGGIGGADIYRVQRVNGAYPAAENLGEPVNEKGLATLEALVAPDQSFLIIGSFGRAGGAGDSDLFVSRRVEGRWSALSPLEAVNTAAREYSPRFSSDGRSLLFASERGLPIEQPARPLTYEEILAGARTIYNGLGNIYSIPLSDLGLHLGSAR